MSPRIVEMNKSTLQAFRLMADAATAENQWTININVNSINHKYDINALALFKGTVHISQNNCEQKETYLVHEQ